jgi:S-adenosylmethionine synthetase
MVIKDLNPLRPTYKKTACYGHFGREDPDYTRERTDKLGAPRRALQASQKR